MTILGHILLRTIIVETIAILLAEYCNRKGDK